MILVTSDLHLSADPRDDYRFAIFNVLKKEVRKHKVEGIVIPGDLTEEKGFHGAELVNRIAREMHALSKACPITFVQGNHDCFPGEEAFFKFLGEFDNISWLDYNATAKMLQTKDSRASKAIFLPYSDDPEKAWKDIDLTSADYIFTHNTFSGADMGGWKSNGPSQDILPDGPTIISGDLHIPQRDGKVIYVGAPYTIDFGDSYEPRLLLLKPNNKIKSIPVETPQKVLIEVATPDDLDLLDDDAVIEGDVVRVVFHEQDVHAVPRKEALDMARAWGEKRGCRIHEIMTINRRKSSKEKDETIGDRRSFKSDGKIFDEYADRQNLNKRLVKVGRNLMQKANL